jgi:hypothetical protein
MVNILIIVPAGFGSSYRPIMDARCYPLGRRDRSRKGNVLRRGELGGPLCCSGCCPWQHTATELWPGTPISEGATACTGKSNLLARSRQRVGPCAKWRHCSTLTGRSCKICRGPYFKKRGRGQLDSCPLVGVPARAPDVPSHVAEISLRSNLAVSG